jgi:hypothetical protein
MKNEKLFACVLLSLISWYVLGMHDPKGIIEKVSNLFSSDNNIYEKYLKRRETYRNPYIVCLNMQKTREIFKQLKVTWNDKELYLLLKDYRTIKSCYGINAEYEPIVWNEKDLEAKCDDYLGGYLLLLNSKKITFFKVNREMLSKLKKAIKEYSSKNSIEDIRNYSSYLKLNVLTDIIKFKKEYDLIVDDFEWV